jgi:DNA-binding FadR family transcriptional regulator
MNPPQSSEANRERLLAVMRVCHRLGQPLPPRTRLAPLVGCTTRQIHRYVERLKAEGVVTLRRGSRCVHVREVRS